MATMRRIKNMAQAATTPRTRGVITNTVVEDDYEVEEELDFPLGDDDGGTLVFPTLRVGTDVLWKLQSACLDSDVDFLPDVYTPKAVEACKAVCAQCPVQEECLQFALDNNINYLIYGGLTPKERKALKS